MLVDGRVPPHHIIIDFRQEEMRQGDEQGLNKLGLDRQVGLIRYFLHSYKQGVLPEKIESWMETG